MIEPEFVDTQREYRRKINERLIELGVCEANASEYTMVTGSPSLAIQAKALATFQLSYEAGPGVLGGTVLDKRWLCRKEDLPKEPPPPEETGMSEDELAAIEEEFSTVYPLNDPKYSGWFKHPEQTRAAVYKLTEEVRRLKEIEARMKGLED